MKDKVTHVRACSLTCFLILALAPILSACGGSDESTSAQAPEGSLSAASAARPVALALPPARGSLQTTGRALDVAINGDGMFVSIDPLNGQRVFSRYGRFDLSRAGILIDSEGRHLVGRPMDAAPGTPAAQLAPIPQTLAPRATTSAVAWFNLDWRSDTRSVGLPVRPDDANTFNNATAFTAYDARGQAFALVLYFRKLSDSEWGIAVTAQGVLLTPSETLHSLVFWPDGQLRTGALLSLSVPAVPLASGGQTTPIERLDLDLSNATGYGSAFSVSGLTQDGHPAGQLTELEVSPRGRITASYSNDQIRLGGQLLLAKFTVADRFGLIGEHGWTCAALCDDPLIEQPGLYLLGELVIGSLER
jgi:flagellar hook protein FlgE